MRPPWQRSRWQRLAGHGVDRPHAARHRRGGAAFRGDTDVPARQGYSELPAVHAVQDDCCRGVAVWPEECGLGERAFATCTDRPPRHDPRLPSPSPKAHAPHKPHHAAHGAP
eukprot:7114049-Prymnesium_polylepis.1